MARATKTVKAVAAPKAARKAAPKAAAKTRKPAAKRVVKAKAAKGKTKIVASVKRAGSARRKAAKV